jgi:hypothetical protein
MRAGLAGGGAQNQDSDTMGRDQRDMVSDLSANPPVVVTLKRMVDVFGQLSYKI